MLKKSIVLFLGMMIFALPASASAATYTVKSGDTLYSIANKYNVSINDIKSLNNLKNNVKIN